VSGGAGRDVYGRKEREGTRPVVKTSLRLTPRAHAHMYIYKNTRAAAVAAAAAFQPAGELSLINLLS